MSDVINNYVVDVANKYMVDIMNKNMADAINKSMVDLINQFMKNSDREGQPHSVLSISADLLLGQIQGEL